MKFDTLVILTAINSGFAILSTNAMDKWFFLIMAVVLVLTLIVGSNGK